MAQQWTGHKLSRRLAFSVTAVTALALLALVMAGHGLPLEYGGAVLLVIGLGSYLVAHRLLANRLSFARATVNRILQSDFANLEPAEESGSSDELGALIDELYRTGVGVEKKMQDLERIEHYRREFLGNVSHELRTPIFSIRGFAETLLEGALEDERNRRSFVQIIQRNAERLNNLAEDLGDVTRIEMGELEMTIEPFSLMLVINEVIESLEPLAETKEVSLRSNVPGSLPDVTGDRERIRQVLTNLVDNAVKYNTSGGHVDVVAHLLPSGEVNVSVVDDGIGISHEHITRLTERFFRVDTSRSRSEGGTGLGLAIVKHILGAHGSRLLIESSPGRGSTFGFSLPTLPQKQ